jgi:hypothetical protein
MIYFVAFGNLMAIGRILPRFGTLYQEKSGSPAAIVGQKKAIKFFRDEKQTSCRTQLFKGVHNN